MIIHACFIYVFFTLSSCFLVNFSLILIDIWLKLDIFLLMLNIVEFWMYHVKKFALSHILLNQIDWNKHNIDLIQTFWWFIMWTTIVVGFCVSKIWIFSVNWNGRSNLWNPNKWILLEIQPIPYERVKCVAGIAVVETGIYFVAG